MILSFRGGKFCVEISKTFSKLLFTVCNRELMIRKLSRRLMKKFDTHEKKKRKRAQHTKLLLSHHLPTKCQENWIHNLDNISDIRQVDTKYLLKDLDFMDSKILMKNSQNGSTKTGLNFTSPSFLFFFSLSLFPKLREKIPEKVLFKLEP